ncbi:MAG: V-type ATP synthase subunit F [Proteobacteria bacterium]|nr:V-type ATP synthase subunit F [Pseudomonadota bacterium]
MKFYCIADEDTVRGFRLAGVDAQAVATPEQAWTAITDASARSDFGIIIITEKVASWIRPQMEMIQLERDRPLIVEIPGPEGPLPGRKSLREFVQEAVGVSVG